MPKADQDLFVKTFREVGTKYQKIVDEAAKDYEAKMVQNGIILHKPDTALFEKAVQPLYEKLGYAEARQRILKELEN
jgi:TRAP-type C4-dicarboxylate transport system substrate-binding protein